MTEEQEKRLKEYNNRIERVMEMFKKYPTQTVGEALSRIYGEMEEDELLEGVLDL